MNSTIPPRFSKKTGILPEYKYLKQYPEKLNLFFADLMQTEKIVQEKWIYTLLENIENTKIPNKWQQEIYWIKQLQKFYPGDIGVLSPLLLNLVVLQPGEALYLPVRKVRIYSSIPTGFH